MKLRFQVEAADGPAILAAAQQRLNEFAGGLDAHLVEISIVKWITALDGTVKAWCAKCEAWVEGPT